VPIRA